MNFKGNIYEKHSFICQCEKKHALNIGEVVIEPGAASSYRWARDELAEIEVALG